MKLRTMAVFGVGYVLGTRAGRERYGQIIEAAQRASKRLDGASGKLGDITGKIDNFGGKLDDFRARLQAYGSD